ncbi:hypothetical protein WG66_010975 [Moniliophthora roreri]|nr:hypothetical protein WG66_010975 [Moniliophthora roreri]
MSIPGTRSLQTLPYDLLLNITAYLDFNDIHALHLTCKSLYYTTTTRPVYRKLAGDLLRRCRPLPLRGFQRLIDLSSEQLIVSVNKAHHYERAWRLRGPRPASGTNSGRMGRMNLNHYLHTPVPTSPNHENAWFRILQSPPEEEVDWLSPITSSYILCATKSGKVVCWDIKTDRCLAEWIPRERWELWKCRVEFDEKMVYFTMAKVLKGSYDDTRLMHFSLMRLSFVDTERSHDHREDSKTPNTTPPPSFSHVTSFRTTGVVMNIFLLDPAARLLSAFIWVSESNTIGLFVLLDWERDEYVFVDTGIECVISSNWSCILYANNIVIHCEDSDAAFQHFYPLSHLEEHVQIARGGLANCVPMYSARVRPWESIVKKFKFPRTASKPTSSRRRVSTGVHTHDWNLELNLGEEQTEDEAAELAGLPTSSGEVDDACGGGNGAESVAHSGSAQSQSASALSLGSTSILVDAPPGSSSFPASASSSTLVPGPAGSSQPQNVLSSEPASEQWGDAAAEMDTTVIISQSLPESQTDTEPEPRESNPFPFPPWYPESAHFVRQWWPSLPSLVNTHAHYRRRDRDDDDTSDTGSYSNSSSSNSPARSQSQQPQTIAVPVPGVPRVSCTVVLLASHDTTTHRTKFVLMQHYFRVPMRGADWVELRARGRGRANTGGDDDGGDNGNLGGGAGAGVTSNSAYSINNGAMVDGHGDDDDSSSDGSGNGHGDGYGQGYGPGNTHPAENNAPLELYMIDEPPEGSVVVDAYRSDRASTGRESSPTASPGRRRPGKEAEEDPMDIWYVAEPFEVVCVLDSTQSDDEDGDGQGGGNEDDERTQERPRPLIAVDFGHAVWIEYVPDEAVEDALDEELELGRRSNSASTHEHDASQSQPVRHERIHNGIESENDPKRLRFVSFPPYSDAEIPNGYREMGEVRTLVIPPELNLDHVETINIDQSQGAVILSVKNGKIFILCYD